MSDSDSDYCPYCGYVARDTRDEIAHMNERHPDVVARRLRDAGFREVGGDR